MHKHEQTILNTIINREHIALNRGNNMRYTLTEKGHIERPIDCLNGSFQKQDNYCYSFEVLCSDNSGTANVHVFDTDYIPRGYYDTVQSVPLNKFFNTVNQLGNKIIMFD